MPPKRGRPAPESSPSTTSTSALTIEDSSAYASSQLSVSSSENNRSTSTIKRFLWNTLSSLSPRKRQKIDTAKESRGTLLLTGSDTSNTVTPASTSQPSTSTVLIHGDEDMPLTNGFVDLAPTKNGESSKTALSLLPDSKLFVYQEGAIRNPLARNHHTTSSSTSSAPMADTRSSSEEAAEMQIQHTSPPSSPESPSTEKDIDEAPEAAKDANAEMDAVEGPTEEALQPEAIPTASAGTENIESTSGVAATEPELQHETETEYKSEAEQEAEHHVNEHEDTAADSQADAAETSAEAAKELEGAAEEAVVAEDMSIYTSQSKGPETASDMPILNLQHEESAAVEDDMSISTSQSQKDNEDASSSNDMGPLPTNEDVQHIQLIANAKVGEHVEGLLDWAGSLSKEEQYSPSAPASEASDDTNSEPIPAAALPSETAAEVVDLVSDSEDESDSDQDDPDKENDGSLVNATPRLDSDATLASTVSGNSTDHRPRGSLIGPLAQKQILGVNQTRTLPQANSLDSGDISATEQIRAIGRQTRFFQPNRGRNNLPQTSTPRQSLPPAPSQNRSFSFSSDISINSTNDTSLARRSSDYRKRNPIYLSRHAKEVEGYNKLSIMRSVEKAIHRVNKIRRMHRRPQLSHENLSQLSEKVIKVHKLVLADNPSMEPIDDFVEKITRRLAIKKRDAETGVMPLPKAKLVERERLERERRAKERRLRGVLGRPALPPTLVNEQEQEVKAVLQKRGKIAEIPGAEVNDHDVQKLKPKQWLNDEVINFYGNLILLRSNEAEKKRTEAMAAAKNTPPSPTPPAGAAGSKKKGKKTKLTRPYNKSLDTYWRVHFFSSFFWANLKQRGFDGVKRWTRRIDIFSKDLILFPINLGNSHWVCGAINMRKHRFEYYDSMGAPNPSAFKLMRDYVTAEAKDKKKTEIDLRGWRDMFSDESPQQENGFDCGVFAAQTLEQISRRDPHTPIPLEAPMIQWKGESLDEGAERLRIDSVAGGEDDDDDDELEYEWNFGQENMPYLRRRMAYEIHSKKLLD
ncbi:hypothetical protein NDA18_002229 [Ustilago nuda]|nr:hypothetical protein NDA18_002229 [Ustilago nuda]